MMARSLIITCEDCMFALLLSSAFTFILCLFILTMSVYQKPLLKARQCAFKRVQDKKPFSVKPAWNRHFLNFDYFGLLPFLNDEKKKTIYLLVIFF